MVSIVDLMPRFAATGIGGVASVLARGTATTTTTTATTSTTSTTTTTTNNNHNK